MIKRKFMKGCLMGEISFYQNAEIDNQLEYFLEENKIKWEDMKMDYQALKEEYARNYLIAIETHFKQEFDIDIDFKYISVGSPKEYNFTTDWIDYEISLEDLKKVRDVVEDINSYVIANFTSGPGFSSFYSNNIGDWYVEKGNISNFDTIQVNTFIAALLEQEREAFDITLHDNMENYTFIQNYLTIKDEKRR